VSIEFIEEQARIEAHVSVHQESSGEHTTKKFSTSASCSFMSLSLE